MNVAGLFEGTIIDLGPIVDSVSEALVIVNQAGRIVLINKPAETLFRYEPGELLGKAIEILVPDRSRGKHSGFRNSYFAHASRRAMGLGRIQAQRKDGTTFLIHVRLNPIRTESDLLVVGLISHAGEASRDEKPLLKPHDLIDHRVAERTAQLEAKNRELEDFVLSASHDLKAPLRVIENCARWLQDDLKNDLTNETQATIGLLRGRVARVKRFLDDLLEYSLIGRETGKQFFQLVSGDYLISSVLALVSPPPQFVVNVSPSFAAIKVPAMPLQQILINLIGNAIKHHNKPDGRIWVSVTENNDQLVFSVQDNGPGIPHEFHDQIFKGFRTLKPKDQIEGNGLGLAMVRKHVEAMGGTLQLDSEKGTGSTFSFTCPKPQYRKSKSHGFLHTA